MDHDHIKIYCAECSEAEYIMTSEVDENDRFMKTSEHIEPLYNAQDGDQLFGKKQKFSLDANKPVKRYKTSKKEQKLPYIY